MTAKELNGLIQQGYQAAQRYEKPLTEVFRSSYRLVGKALAERFRYRQQTITASSDWTPPPGGIFDDGDAKEIAADGASPLYEKMLEAAMGPLAQGGDFTFDIGSEAAQQLLESMSGITDQIAEGVKDPALRAIGQAWNAGLTVKDAAQAIQDAVDSIAGAEANALARTSLNAISNGAAHIGVQQLNAGGEMFGSKRWLTAHDNRVRPTHADAEGQTVGIREPFDVGGAKLQFPGDPSGPITEIIQCRCVLIYEEAGVPPSTLPFAQEVIPMRARNSITTTTNTNLPPGSYDVAPNGVTIVINGPSQSAPDVTCASCGATVGADMSNCPNCGASMIVSGAAPAIAWEGTLAIEGYPTDDGRYLVPGAIGERELPLTLMAMIANVGEGHDGAQAAGKIEQIWREPATDLGPNAVRIMGSGHFDTGEFGQEIARMVGEDTLNGISVDLAIADVALLDKDTFQPVDESTVGLVDILSGAYLYGVTSATIMAATVCPMPAFADANDISLVAAGEPRLMTFTMPLRWELGIVRSSVLTSIADHEWTRVASAAPLHPSRACFVDPQLKQVTPMTYTEDGRIYGHLTTWDSCHTGVLDRCMTPFRSRSNYAFFHTGVVETEEGEFIPVGRISLGTNHAHLELDAARARSHYDHTGTVGAFVRAGEDQFGIWLAGVVRHDLPEAALRDMRANPPSGDWRRRELIGVLCVPFPGYPVPNLALVASGDDEEVLTMITGLETFGAIPPRSTPVEDGTWDAGANTKRISDDAGAATLRKMYAYVDSAADPNTKSAYSFPHHFVDSGGNVGAASINGVNNAMARLPNSGASDKEGVRRHLERHQNDYKRRQGQDGMGGQEFEASLEALSELAGV